MVALASGAASPIIARSGSRLARSCGGCLLKKPSTGAPRSLRGPNLFGALAGVGFLAGVLGGFLVGFLGFRWAFTGEAWRSASLLPTTVRFNPIWMESGLPSTVMVVLPL